MTGRSVPRLCTRLPLGIALDDIASKKDIKGAIQEYRTELMLYSAADTTKGQGLVDTLQLAEAYAMPGDSRDMVQAAWLYARAWNFAPLAYKTQIEPKAPKYWYKTYHGGLDGLDDIKTQAATTMFPPDALNIKPVQQPAQIPAKV